MNRYLIGYKVEGGLKSHIGDCDFTVEAANVRIHFPESQDRGELEFFVTLTAINHKQAFEQGFEIVDRVLDSLSFIMKSSFYTWGVFVILKDEKGESERTVFRQTSEEIITGFYLKQDTKEAAQKALSISQIEDKYWLALRWLRYGHRARTTIEQFTYYWLAFERSIGEKQIEKRCEKCGTISYHPGIDKNEAKELLTKYDSSINEEGFKTIWKYRQKVFHGGEKLTLSLARELRTMSLIVGQAAEKLLEEKFQPSRRITVERPVYFLHRTSDNGYYKFTTSKPNESFAMDFPTNQQLLEFQQTHLVKSPYGFEILDFNKQDEW